MPKRRQPATLSAAALAAALVLAPATPRADEFALLFRPGDIAPDGHGATGEANRATLGRLQQALSLRPSGAAFEILLVGPRPDYCTSASVCNALLFRRLRHVRDVLERRDAAAAQGLNDNSAKYSGELLPPPVLPSLISPGQAAPNDVLYVRTRLSRPVRPDDACPWTLHVADPLLPPALDGQTVEIQAVSPRLLPVTAASTIRVTATGHRGRPTAILWDGQGKFTRGPSGAAVTLAAMTGVERLHLITAEKADHPLLRAVDQLATTPAADVAELLARASSATSKAFGDQATRVRIEDLAAPRSAPEVVTCTVTLQTIAAIR